MLLGGLRFCFRKSREVGLYRHGAPKRIELYILVSPTKKSKESTDPPYSRSFADFRCLTILVSGRSNEALNLGALGLKIVQLR